MEMNKEQLDAFNAFVLASVPEKDKVVINGMENLVNSFNVVMENMYNKLCDIHDANVEMNQALNTRINVLIHEVPLINKRPQSKSKEIIPEVKPKRKYTRKSK